MRIKSEEGHVLDLRGKESLDGTYSILMTIYRNPGKHFELILTETNAMQIACANESQTRERRQHVVIFGGSGDCLDCVTYEFGTYLASGSHVVVEYKDPFHFVRKDVPTVSDIKLTFCGEANISLYTWLKSYRTYIEHRLSKDVCLIQEKKI